MKKTVVELDLVGYSTIGETFAHGLTEQAVAELNQQIQAFIDAGLTAVNAPRDRTVMATTGDGAILVFDAAEGAHHFLQAVHDATREHNRTRKPPLAKRVFRSGAATGEIVIEPKPGGGFDIAGTTIARAVRLEAKANPGGLMVDEATYAGLSAEQRSQYGAKTRVPGKRDEEFEAYACQVNADGPRDAAFFTEQAKKEPAAEVAKDFGRDHRREVLARFKRLKSHQYSELIFLLEMPIGQRPSDTLHLDEKQARILYWAEEHDRLSTLLEALRELTGEEGVASLIARLVTADPVQRYWLYIAIGRAGGAEAQRFLEGAAGRESDPFARRGIEDARELLARTRPAS